MRAVVKERKFFPMASLLIGCAGWSIPPQEQTVFPINGSHLERYAHRLSAVEINSSFYRPHRTTTYARWAAAVPDGFRFSVKMRKTITHGARLVETDGLLDAFLAQTSGLGSKLGVLLVQLPPSLRFEAQTIDCFFTSLRERHAGPVACDLAPVLRTSGCATEEHNRYGNCTEQVWQAI